MTPAGAHSRGADPVWDTRALREGLQRQFFAGLLEMSGSPLQVVEPSTAGSVRTNSGTGRRRRCPGSWRHCRRCARAKAIENWVQHAFRNEAPTA